MFELAIAFWLAAETAVPARMTSCTIIPASIERRGTAPPEAIAVSFMITGDHEADLVRFTAVAPAGGYREFTAHGDFTKSVMIEGRELHADATTAVRPLPHGIECAITYIHYVDGSSWSAPRPSTPLRMTRSG